MEPPMQGRYLRRMNMSALLRVRLSPAPRVCAFCDQGTGILRDERLGTLRSCGACGGTGRETLSTSSLQELVDRRMAPHHPRAPRNAA